MIIHTVANQRHRLVTQVGYHDFAAAALARRIAIAIDNLTNDFIVVDVVAAVIDTFGALPGDFLEFVKFYEAAYK